MRMTIKFVAVAAAFAGALSFAGAGLCDDLRLLSLGGGRIALEDEDSRLNPYDFGGNPAYLVRDYEFDWTRIASASNGEFGALRRPLDPDRIISSYGLASGLRSLGERHVIMGSIRVGRLEHRGVFRSLEIDQYNDPFYMTDLTSGSFEHDGLIMGVDYGLRLRPKVYLGGGLDYDISSGLKDKYTRPEIVHNRFAGKLGVIYEARPDWALGLVFRPARTQNRTSFAKTDEGFDNLIYRYYGDGIYDIYSVSTYTVREILQGFEFGVQNFYMGERFKAGAQFTYGVDKNKVRYGSTTQYLKGYWQSTAYDFMLVGRYSFENAPLTLGLSGRYTADDGWAKRPDFEKFLLYENPFNVLSVGAGVTYRIAPIKTLAAAEYTANLYDIEVTDHGADFAQSAEVVQNVGRLGLEYSLFDLHAIRAGLEVTDFLIDRWLKQPPNTDRYKFSGGVSYRTGFWNVDAHLEYGICTKNSIDAERKSYGGVIAFTRLFK